MRNVFWVLIDGATLIQKSKCLGVICRDCLMSSSQALSPEQTPALPPAYITLVKLEKW